MTGRRFLIGVIAMAGIVPAILFYFLEMNALWQWFTIASTCMLGWGIADFTANLVVRPRLRDRQPTDAIRGWDPWRDPERRVSGPPDRRAEDAE